MKTQEELNQLKQDIETMSKKLSELDDNELEHVTGGWHKPEIFSPILRLIITKKDGQALTNKAISEDELKIANGEYTPKPEPVINMSVGCASPEEKLGGKIVVIGTDEHIKPFTNEE